MQINSIYMKNISFLLVLMMLMASCSNSGSKTKSDEKASPTEIVISNDLENAAGLIPSWYNEKSVVKIKDPVAHSGD